MLGIVKGTEDSLFVLADSDAGGVEIDDVQAVAETALGTGKTARATEPTRLGRQALVAEPLIEDGERPRRRGVRRRAHRRAGQRVADPPPHPRRRRRSRS